MQQRKGLDVYCSAHVRPMTIIPMMKMICTNNVNRKPPMGRITQNNLSTKNLMRVPTEIEVIFLMCTYNLKT